MADDAGTQNLFGSIISDAFKFATPFAQKLLGQSSTPQQLQNETLRTAALNGSGPNDPTLATQSPTGLWDFITGGKSGATQTTGGAGGLTSGSNLTFIGIIAVVLIAVLVILKR